jgi:hypothetical protein
MKSYIFLGILFLVTLLAGCSSDSQPQPKTYPVPPTITAMNVELDGKAYQIEQGKNGWVGQTNSRLINGVAFVQHTGKFSQQIVTGNEVKEANFTIALPPFYVADMSNVQISYNYRTFLDFVGKGQKVLQTPQQRDGYQIWFSYVDMANLKNNFSYRSETGSQPTGKIEVTNVKELGNEQVVVTYALDCDMHTDMGAVNGRLKGTIQLLFNFKQF